MRCAAVVLASLLAASPLARAEDPPQPELPDALQGFAGQLYGTVARTYGEAPAFLLEVTRVDRTWEHNKAAQPSAAVGKRLLINLRWEKDGDRWRPAPRQVAWLRTLSQGQQVRVDVRNDEGQRLHLMELDAEQRRLVERIEGDRPGDGDRPRGGDRPRDGDRADRKAPARLPDPELPAGFRGFSGTVAGLCVSVGEGEFLFLVSDVTKTWKDNEAEQPRSIVWRAVRVEARRKDDGRFEPRHMRWIRTLVPGEDYRIELEHRDGRLFILELNEAQRRAAGDGD